MKWNKSSSSIKTKPNSSIISNKGIMSKMDENRPISEVSPLASSYADSQINEAPVFQGNTGNDIGISTTGYRSGRYNPNEWQELTYNKYYQAFADRDNSEKNRNESDRLINETNATTKRNQDTTTKNLQERLHDINFWKSELEREWQDMVDETETLVSEKKRFENALKTTETVLHIATDNLTCRDKRYGIDKVEDEVEVALLQELDIIQKVQNLYKRTLKEIDLQVVRNHSAKEIVEMDWSNKKEADEYDGFCARLTNENTNKQFYSGVSRFQEYNSLPENWAQHSHDNIVQCEMERMASQQLRTLIENMINDCTRDMRQQADIVERAFGRRINQLEDALAKLQDNLSKIIKEITDQENKVRDLKEAIRAKDDPIKVAQTRLHSRNYRPGVDICRDVPQHQLVGEMDELNQIVDALTMQLHESEQSLKQLMDDRMALEKEVITKKNSIFIDKEKCFSKRTRYPTMPRLRGYHD